MINRILRHRQEPGSIFEHVDAHVRPGVEGLADGGEELPDEEAFSHGELSLAPGALDGILAGPDDPDEVRAAVDRIYTALAELADKPGAATRRRLRERFREGHVRARIDALRERLGDAPPANAERLYPELREIFLRSGHRDEVKYAMVLMSGFRRPEDADLFRVIGRHEEFTLYAAVALATVTDDPVGEWLALLPHVTGWGRTELSGLILREPRSRDVREQLVRSGPGMGNALELATECRLDELLAHDDVDDDLLAGAREIVDALISDWQQASLIDYPEAGPAVEALVRHLADRAPGSAELDFIAHLQRFLTDDGSRYDEEAAEESFEACGLDDDRLERLVARCATLLADRPG